MVGWLVRRVWRVRRRGVLGVFGACVFGVCVFGWGVGVRSEGA